MVQIEEEKQHNELASSIAAQKSIAQETIQKLKAEKELAFGQVQDTVALFALKEGELEQLNIQLLKSQEEAKMLRETLNSQKNTLHLESSKFQEDLIST